VWFGWGDKEDKEDRGDKGEILGFCLKAFCLSSVPSSFYLFTFFPRASVQASKSAFSCASVPIYKNPQQDIDKPARSRKILSSTFPNISFVIEIWFD